MSDTIGESLKKEVIDKMHEAEKKFVECYRKDFPRLSYGVINNCGVPYMEELNSLYKEYRDAKVMESLYGGAYASWRAKSTIKHKMEEYHTHEDKLIECITKNHISNAKFPHDSYCLRKFRQNFKSDRENAYEYK